jgi:DNA-directed RNA polymerase subunit F
MAKRKKARRKSAALSPLVRSAFEVLEHGLFHYLRSNTPKDMKFALLHVDQAVELLLKERVRKGGKSINKPNNPKETVTIWQAYDILEKDLKCAIPERPDLELLHEERNNIQHKYANPSPEDADFHVGNAMKFVDRFVRDELKLNLADFLPSDFLTRVLP